jgi:aspartate carbamoyltransferase catalytic subunit
MKRLGGEVVQVTADKSSVVKGESLQIPFAPWQGKNYPRFLS